MSAPVTDPLSSSISSSGHTDGLGRRALAFDRESGAVLERLHVRPEFAVFEQVIRRRLSQVTGLEDERFARPLRIERDGNGDLIVVSEFITGSRLSDLLDVSADAAVVPGVDVALGYLLEALPALAALHTTARVTHGLIDPSRTMLTPQGQVAFLDLSFGPVVEMLRLSPDRLWDEFGVSTLTSGAPFDAASDVMQVALSGLMLVLGRSLRADEHPDAIDALLMEVIEVAHIRGSTAFANGLEQFLRRALPLPGRQRYESADAALADVSLLVRGEIGLEVCKQALVDFVAQMDTAYAASRDSDDAADADTIGEPHEIAFDANEPVTLELIEPVLDFTAAVPEDTSVAPSAQNEVPPSELAIEEEEGEDGEELELSLEGEPAAPAHVEEVYDLEPMFADPARVSSELASLGGIAPSRKPEPVASEPPPAPVFVEPEPAVEPAPAPYAVGPAPAPRVDVPAPVVEVAPAPVAPAVATPADPPPAPPVSVPPVPAPTPAAVAPPEPPPVREEAATLEAVAAQIAGAASVETNAALGAPDQPDQPEAAPSRRRKRQQQKSARARKDKLRSAAAGEGGQKTAPPPPPPPLPLKPSTATGWTVSAPRPAESLILDPPVAPVAPPPPRPVPPPMPTMPSFSPTPVGQVPLPTYASPAAQTSGYGTPSVIRPAPTPPPTPPPMPRVTSGHLKVKAEPPQGFAAKKPAPIEPPVLYSGPDRFGTLSLGQPAEDDAPRGFPWKLAAVAVAVAVVAIIAGRSYLPGRTAVAGEPGAATELEAEAAPPAAAAVPEKPEAPIGAGRGRISIKTEPSGIKVLLDRKPIGETPLDVEAPPGRRVLTFLTSGGEVIHSVRVVAGKTTVMDVPVFSGWVSIVAPVLLDISENGRSLGTTEQNRLMLPPGRHQLTLSNKDLGYSETRDVDIEPGGVRSITVDPKGAANLNASPWAEVWLESTKLGETPLSNVQVPLGLHEFVFKHPQFGERRVSATIRANAPAALSVDFSK